MRTDFAGGRHFLRSERSDSGRHKVTLWRPEKMAEHGKDVADTGIYGARLRRALAVRKYLSGALCAPKTWE